MKKKPTRPINTALPTAGIDTPCPHCGTTIDPTWISSQGARIAGTKKSRAKSKASKANGKKGGRPIKEKT